MLVESVLQGTWSESVIDYATTEATGGGIKMDKSYTDENGGMQEVSETTESRWHISADTRNTLALFVGAVTLLACVWGVCEYSISRLSDRFDQIDARLDEQDDRIDRRFDEQNDRIDGRFDEQDRKLDHANGRIDRLEAKVDRIETLLIDYLLRIAVPGEGSSPDSAAQPAGLGKGTSQDLPAKPVVPRTGAAHGGFSPSSVSPRTASRGAALHPGPGISFGERRGPRGR